MPQPISNQQFGSQSMSQPATTNPNIGKIVTGSMGAQFDMTQVTMSTNAGMGGKKTYGADGVPTSGHIGSNRYPKETWQNYTSRPNSRWAQVHGGTLDRSNPANPILKPFNNTPKPVGMG